MSQRIDAVLLIGFGGPTRGEEIRPFLDQVLRGRPVTKERYEEVVRHYEVMGGRSPYSDLTMRQADTLRTRLKREGIEIPVVVGMRNWDPYLLDTIRELAGLGVRRVLGFILAAHRCEASWERYRATVSDTRSRIGMHAPEVEYPRAWHADPKFIEAVSSRAREALAKMDPLERKSAHLIFTAHSIPVSMSDASGYADQIRQSAGLVAAQIGQDSWTLAFQSRSGSTRDPWLEPDIGDVIRKLQGGPALVVPIGFLCDHVEVLYDLDVEAAKIAREAGVNMVRAATVGDHPAFIGMIADVVRQHLGR